jgi:hypothetical protein
VVCYGNEIVRRVDSVKYLGLHLDSKISFYSRICCIRKKILPIMFALRRSRHLITHDTVISVNYAYVFFHDIQLISVAEMHRYPTRSNDNFVVFNFRTNRGRDSIVYRLIDGLIKFNNLPDIV